MTDRPPIWPVFLAYVTAFVGIVTLSIVAAIALRASYPDLSDREVIEGLPGLLAGGVASSTALVITVLMTVRPLDPAMMRLRPGRESGPAVLIMVLGVLGLAQALDSLAVLTKVDQQGALAVIRRALAGVTGPELFAAVLVIGVLAGAAEEIFFRGFMQTRLVGRLSRFQAVVVTGACFALLHLDWLHALLAFALGLYLGYITEWSGSALPAIVCHVANNAIFTVLTAVFGAVGGTAENVALLVLGGAACAGALIWLGRRQPVW